MSECRLQKRAVWDFRHNLQPMDLQALDIPTTEDRCTCCAGLVLIACSVTHPRLGRVILILSLAHMQSFRYASAAAFKEGFTTLTAVSRKAILHIVLAYSVPWKFTPLTSMHFSLSNEPLRYCLAIFRSLFMLLKTNLNIICQFNSCTLLRRIRLKPPRVLLGHYAWPAFACLRWRSVAVCRFAWGALWYAVIACDLGVAVIEHLCCSGVCLTMVLVMHANNVFLHCLKPSECNCPLAHLLQPVHYASTTGPQQKL